MHLLKEEEETVTVDNSSVLVENSLLRAQRLVQILGNRWYFDEMVGNTVHHDEFG
jgi:hypothetical protein